MELMYTSTRNANEKVTASQAILKRTCRGRRIICSGTASDIG